jgi:hypothetical protein
MQVIAHLYVESGFDAEQSGLLLEQAANPIPPITEVHSRKRIDSRQKRTTHATGVTMDNLDPISD